MKASRTHTQGLSSPALRCVPQIFPLRFRITKDRRDVRNIIKGEDVNLELRVDDHEADVAAHDAFPDDVVPLSTSLQTVQLTDTAAPEVELCHDTLVDVDEMSAENLTDPAAEAVLPEEPPGIEGEEKCGGETASEVTRKNQASRHRIGRMSKNKSSKATQQRSSTLWGRYVGL